VGCVLSLLGLGGGWGSGLSSDLNNAGLTFDGLRDGAVGVEETLRVLLRRAHDLHLADLEITQRNDRVASLGEVVASTS